MSGSASPWQELADRVKSRRASRVYMPAALLAAIDVLESRGDGRGHFRFEDFDQRFRELMRTVSASGVGRGWQPFFHLSGGAEAWSLQLDGTPAAFDGRPKSRAALVERADVAVLAPALLEHLRTRGSDQARGPILALLASDDEEDSAALIAAAGGQDRG